MDLIYNAYRTPDGTVMVSRSRHDYNEHVDTTNGKTYIIDGGRDYIRRTNHGDEVSLCVYSDAPHEEIREVFEWGSRGKDGKQPLTYLVLKDMETDHIQAILATQTHIKHSTKCIFVDELAYRENLN